MTDDIKPAAQGDCAALASSPMEDLYALQREVRHCMHDQLQLAALEARLASRSLMTMISAAVCIGALLLLVWVGLIGAAGLMLMETGLAPVLVVLLLTALTSIVVLLLLRLIRQRLYDLGFPATLRTLKPSATGDPERDST